MRKTHISKLISLFAVLLAMTAFALPVGATEIAGAAPVSAAYTMQVDDTVQENSVNPEDTASANADMDTGNPISTAENKQQAEPVKAKNPNAPFLTGAVLAVLAFIGVAVFCKFKGNK